MKAASSEVVKLSLQIKSCVHSTLTLLKFFFVNKMKGITKN